MTDWNDENDPKRAKRSGVDEDPGVVPSSCHEQVIELPEWWMEVASTPEEFREVMTELIEKGWVQLTNDPTSEVTCDQVQGMLDIN